VNENLGFTDRCIARLQRLSIKDGLFAMALTSYLVGHGRLFHDGRLFWVRPPSGPMQVAAWMIVDA
jgi:hypothetical protein